MAYSNIAVGDVSVDEMHRAIATCAGMRTNDSEVSLAHLNPPSRTVGPVKLPLSNHVLYRGIVSQNPQFNAPRALRALLGEQQWYAGSPMFWSIVQTIEKKIRLDQPMIPQAGYDYPTQTYLEKRHILEAVNSVLRCTSSATPPLEVAEMLAADVMNKMFREMSNERIESLYFNTQDPLYYDAQQNKLGFGNKMIDLVAATAYELVAASYGRKVLVVQDIHHRTADLELYNLVRNNKLVDAWMDYGEVDFPGYLRGDEVIGYQEHVRDRQRPGHAMIHSSITLALYQFNVAGQTFVLALEPGTECIAQGHDFKYYTCNNFGDDIENGLTQIPQPVTETFRDRTGLLGVFMLCARNKPADCKVPKEIFNWYGKYSKTAKLDSDFIDGAESMILNGKEVHYFEFKPEYLEKHESP